jgi:hypothetical protein
MEDDYAALVANSFTNPLTFGGLSAAEVLAGQSNQDANTTSTEVDVLRYPYAKIDAATDYFSMQMFNYNGGSDIYGLTDKDTKGQTLTDLLLSLGDKSGKIETEIGNPIEGGSKLISDLQTIFLPMPQNISDTLSVGYAEDTLNPLQVAGLNVASSLTKGEVFNKEKIDETFEKIKALGTGVGPDEIQALRDGLSAVAINQLGANVRPQSIITRASGQILQSNLELLFNNVTLRSFSFAFDFAPRNPTEADIVAKIIRTIKSGMMPRKGENPAVFIKSPKLVKLAYMKGSEPHPFLNKMKVGVLTDMSMNYTGSNTYATYDDGTPVHMTMQFTFKEINPVYADDYFGEGQAGVAADGGVGY